MRATKRQLRSDQPRPAGPGNTAADAVPAANQRRRARRWLAATGAAVALWGGFALWKAFDIRQPTAYRPMGPRVFPVIISCSLIVIGVLFVIETLRRADEAVEDHVVEELRTADHKQAALVVALLLAYASVFERIGYIVATTAFLPAVAYVLGSRRLLRDLVVAVVLAVVAFSVFTELLNIDLPKGVMEGVAP